MFLLRLEVVQIYYVAYRNTCVICWTWFSFTKGLFKLNFKKNLSKKGDNWFPYLESPESTLVSGMLDAGSSLASAFLCPDSIPLLVQCGGSCRFKLHPRKLSNLRTQSFFPPQVSCVSLYQVESRDPSWTCHWGETDYAGWSILRLTILSPLQQPPFI